MTDAPKEAESESVLTYRAYRLLNDTHFGSLSAQEREKVYEEAITLLREAAKAAREAR